MDNNQNFIDTLRQVAYERVFPNGDTPEFCCNYLEHSKKYDDLCTYLLNYKDDSVRRTIFDLDSVVGQRLNDFVEAGYIRGLLDGISLMKVK